ncbi:MAG: acyl transferase, partial [Flavobacteriales bacterium]
TQIQNSSGGINVVDLANIHSCCFIATQDLGEFSGAGFSVSGRFDHSDARGCNLLFSR